MTKISELPRGTRIEFLAFDNWKRYADTKGFWMDRPATRPGYYSMINGFPPVGPNLRTPPDFQYDIVEP